MAGFQHSSGQEFKTHIPIAIDANVARRVVNAPFLVGGHLGSPDWNEVESPCLSDVRSFSEVARQRCLLGEPPQSALFPSFDPRLGPFSSPASVHNDWAQSLDFLRDIHGLEVDGEPLSACWLKAWCQTTSQPFQAFSGLLPEHDSHASTKTQRMIWRSTRFINCLVYGLPLLKYLEPLIAQRFWHHLLTDLIKLCVPTKSLLETLTGGGHPQSPRALWLRALAIVCASVVFRGYLLAQVVRDSIAHLSSVIEKDGTMRGGSIMATLSAGADLAMIAHLPEIAPIFSRVRQALLTLTHDSGNLVMFGEGGGDYNALLSRICGQIPANRSAILSSLGVGHASAVGTNVWLRSPKNASQCVGLCDVEIEGASVLSHSGLARTGLWFPAPVHVNSTRIKRRDETEHFILETQSVLSVEGAGFNFNRVLKLSKNGQMLTCEDLITSDNTSHRQSDKTPLELQLRFALPQNCQVTMVRDGCSAIIVTPNRKSLRLRVSGPQFEAEEPIKSGIFATTDGFVEFRVTICWRNNKFWTNWTLNTEGW